MRRKTFWINGLGIAAVLMTATAQGGEAWNAFWARFHLDYHRNAAWPEPFISADRQIMRQYWEISEAGGWRLQNTLGNELFNVDTHTLNTAGEKKIDWILVQAPPHRRQVFVLKADNGQHTSQRIASVNEYLARIIPDAIPPVCETDRVPPGINGEYLNAMETLYRSTQPAPRLPAASSGTTSSGSSGGGGGSGGGSGGSGS